MFFPLWWRVKAIKKMIFRKLPIHLRRGFTLVEMLVAITVLVILLGIISAVTQGTTVAVRQATGKLSTYAAARAAFSTMTAKLGQATLNAYLDYYDTGLPAPSLRTKDNASTFVPTNYGRVSDLQFIIRPNTPVSNSGSGQEVYFQCPEAYSSDDASYQSTQGLLNACGYYVQYGDTSYTSGGSTSGWRPSLIGASKFRYRLMQAIEPSDQLATYASTAGSDAVNATSNSDDQTIPATPGSPAEPSWLRNIYNTGNGNPPAPDALPLADNVIALIVWPRLPVDQDANGTQLTTNYTYDSQLNVDSFTGTGGSQPLTANQLPPIVQVTMVVIDEASAARLCTSNTPPTIISGASGALSGKFNNVANYATDLADLENKLSNNHINFEVLNSSIVMRESKWSGQ